MYRVYCSAWKVIELNWIAMIFDHHILSNCSEGNRLNIKLYPAIPISRGELSLHGNKLRLPILSFYQMHSTEEIQLQTRCNNKFEVHVKKFCEEKDTSCEERWWGEGNEKITIRSRITISTNITYTYRELNHIISYRPPILYSVESRILWKFMNFSEILLINGKF